MFLYPYILIALGLLPLDMLLTARLRLSLQRRGFDYRSGQTGDGLGARSSEPDAGGNRNGEQGKMTICSVHLEDPVEVVNDQV
ncbi:hypothetical protein N657DRAFT_645259 [Parathielavia appendiculata]|uniref:Uncharacterized protein n=1 Tax=Parathielavia appendiculata TaxID=2587402 RepID=A0AAN6TZJ3_9PEZI|nr:hypothetical protein N657DRAFT_645259 [Parathielavia appendiculata]